MCVATSSRTKLSNTASDAPRLRSEAKEVTSICALRAAALNSLTVVEYNSDEPTSESKATRFHPNRAHSLTQVFAKYVSVLMVRRNVGNRDLTCGCI